MKSIPAVTYALLITVVAIAITPFYQSKIAYVLSIIVITATWMIVLYQSQRDSKKHDVVIERVERLKEFSIQLQSLINKELALVQEDVTRTRQIINDSIELLQNSSQVVSANMLSQQQCLNELLEVVEHTQSLSVANQKNVQAISTTTNINSIDLRKVRAIDGINKDTKKSIDSMIMALQFEDIVGQISERVVQHIGDIRSTVDILSKLCESEFSATFEEDMDKMQIEYMAIKEALLKVSSKNLAAQKNMDEGDVDLF